MGVIEICIIVYHMGYGTSGGTSDNSCVFWGGLVYSWLAGRLEDEDCSVQRLDKS